MLAYEGVYIMDQILLEFLTLLLHWVGIFTVITMGIGVFLIAMMVLFLVRMMWKHLKGPTYEYSSDDDTEE